MKFTFDKLTGGVIATVLLLLLQGCGNEPAKIYYGEDECEHCRMIITDARFAAQLVSSTGKAYKFDAIECMAAYLNHHEDLDTESSKLWVNDYSNPEHWLRLDNAEFVRSKEVRSPMGLSLLALPGEEAVQQHLNRHPGDTVSWNHIRQLVRDEWEGDGMQMDM